MKNKMMIGLMTSVRILHDIPYDINMSDGRGGSKVFSVVEIVPAFCPTSILSLIYFRKGKGEVSFEVVFKYDISVVSSSAVRVS